LVGKNVTVTGWVDNNTKTIKVLQIREGSIPQNNEKWYIRIYNVDDSGYSAIKINDCLVSETNSCFDTLLTATYGQDTGYYDITNYISNGENTLKFQMYNYGQGYTWGFQIKRGDSVVFNQSAGTAGVSGANNNDQNSTYRYVYDKEITFSTNDRNLVEKNNLTGQVINRTY
jgi:hypothetical protein